MADHIFTCQQCKKEFVDNKNSWRNPKFCSIECFHKYKQVTIQCLYCNKEFTVPRSQKNRKFCSPKCNNRYYIKPNPDKKSIFVCEWCKQEFEDWVYRQPRFCSAQCRSKYAARQPKGTRKPEIHITKICENCHKPYQTTTHQVKYRNSRFCSLRCRYETMSIERRGSNNPAWTGGTVHWEKYGEDWYTQCKKTKKRDKSTCQVCGYKAGGNRIIDVHHIIPIKYFNENQNPNELSNLITLCRLCHRKVEMGKIPCPKPKAS